MELHESQPDDATTRDVRRIFENHGFQTTLQYSAPDPPRTILLHARRTA